MSKTKLIQNLQDKLTSKRITYDLPPIQYRFTEDMNENVIDLTVQHGVEYKLEVQFGVCEFISQELLDSSRDPIGVKHMTKKRMGKSITNAVYGDVQQKLIDILDEVRYKYPNNRELLQKLYETIEMMDYDG
jgi:hypothetical protein